MEFSRPIPWLRKLRGHLAEDGGRTFWLVVLNGVIFQASAVMLDGRRVCAALLMELTGREWMVGLVVGIAMAAMGAPQLYTAYLLSDGRRRMPLYIRGAQVRWAALALLVLSTATLGRHPLWMAGMVLLCLGLTWAGTGVGIPAFGDIVSRTVDAQRRGKLFGHRLLFGGLFSLVLGALVKRVLSPDFSIRFPYNYALLFGVGLVMLISAQLCFMQVHEPEVRGHQRNYPTFLGFLSRSTRRVLKDPDAVRFVAYSASSNLAWAPLALLVPYAMKELHFDASVTGSLVVVGVLASSLSNPVWAWLSDHVGNRVLLRLTAAGAIVALALLALSSAVAEQFSTIAGVPAALFWILLVNAAAEMANTGAMIGRNNYVYEMAPSGGVATYIALLNFLTSPIAALAYPLCGWLAGRYGYPIVFAISGVFGVVRIFAAVRLSEPRHAEAAEG